MGGLLEVFAWWGMRDPVSALSHGVGSLLALVGTVVLVRRTRTNGFGRRELLGVLVYGISLVIVFGASTVFHTIQASEIRIERFKMVDHATIFFTIAATATAFYSVFRLSWTEMLVSIVWVMTTVAIVLKVVIWPMGLWTTAFIYIGVGSVAASGLVPLAVRDGLDRFGLFVGGIGVHILGAVVFALGTTRPWPGYVEGHEVFHVLVLAGSLLQYIFLYRAFNRPLVEAQV